MSNNCGFLMLRNRKIQRKKHNRTTWYCQKRGFGAFFQHLCLIKVQEFLLTLVLENPAFGNTSTLAATVFSA